MQPVTHNQLGTKSTSGAPEESEAPETIGGPSRTRTLDPLIKSANQRVQRDHSDTLNVQQLELWPDAE